MHCAVNKGNIICIYDVGQCQHGPILRIQNKAFKRGCPVGMVHGDFADLFEKIPQKKSEKRDGETAEWKYL